MHGGGGGGSDDHDVGDEEAAAGNPFVQELWSVEGNAACADCSAPRPTWASRSLGITICKLCAGVHRRLGVHLSFVRSLTLDAWSDEDRAYMLARGNARSNAVWEFRSDAAADVKPYSDDFYDSASHRMHVHATYVRSKYEHAVFTTTGTGVLVPWDDGRAASTSDSRAGLVQNSGVLMLVNMRAEGLPRMDLPPFQSDPYLVLTLGGRQRSRTTTIHNCRNPVWSHDKVNLNVQTMDQIFQVEIWDEDLVTPDDPIGTMSFPLREHFTPEKLSDVTSGGSVTVDVTLNVVNPGPGTLSFSMVYTSLQ